MNELLAIAFNKNNIYCDKSPKGYGIAYFASHNFHKGDAVMHGFGKIVDHQTKHISIQISSNKHYIPTKWTGRYLNHSCDPSCFIHTRSDGFPDMVALKNIKKGEEITFAYFMTEYSWSSHSQDEYIPCLCGAKKCFKKILFFSQLTDKQKNSLKRKKLISSYLYNI